MMRRSFVLVLVLAACGGGEDKDPIPADSASQSDGPAPVATVETVTCDGTESAEIKTMNFAFVPNAATISAGQTIKFTTESNHNVIPVNSDPGLTVGFGATKCLKFTEAGTFRFRCQPHGQMTGTITVN